MKNLIPFLILFLTSYHLSAQEMVVKDDLATDSMRTYCKDCYKNILSAGGKYYLSPLDNTRTTLANNGFSLDKEAYEVQIRLYNLPKLFYYYQLGTLSQTNYATVNGFGVKEDIRFPLFKNSNFILTPYIELGGGYYRMNIVKGVTSNSITSVLASQVETHTLDNFIVSGDVGLDLGYRFKIDHRSVSLVLNGGYISNIPSQWRLGGSLAFKEKINLTSPYAGVSIRLDMHCTDCNSGMDQSCCK